MNSRNIPALHASEILYVTLWTAFICVVVNDYIVVGYSLVHRMASLLESKCKVYDDVSVCHTIPSVVCVYDAVVSLVKPTGWQRT